MAMLELSEVLYNVCSPHSLSSQVIHLEPGNAWSSASFYNDNYFILVRNVSEPELNLSVVKTRTQNNTFLKTELTSHQIRRNRQHAGPPKTLESS